ncbi:hypothetical protein [Nostoc sp. ChiQUE01b]|uniref:hypothetical protein n=1 Tax=Nostoc sp. ChiQUE01b TaxID=3075376 RepID=UPI002AD49D95|nr:hypothetical protein [Nostoc sp. ChiQUE01b]MDZ8258022.1 hypothetical protein [Nostoc sp. ChiQUE01b]
MTSQRNQLVRNGYLAIFGNNPPHENDQRQVAACLRDLNYYIAPIIESCRQGSVEPLDQIIPGIKEMNNSLGYPNSWFVTFYESIKQNHGLTGESANVVNSYLDYAINSFS